MEKEKTIQRISFIGSGNVASHLAEALVRQGKQIEEVYSPSPEHAKTFAERWKCRVVNRLSDLQPQVDLCLISIPDDSIKSVADTIPEIKGIVAHTSGITSMDVLKKHKRHGVFYPLQTFTKDRRLALEKSPFCIESNNQSDKVLLMDLAGLITEKVFEINSEQRRYLHLTAVMVSNFSNHLYHLAHEVLESKGLDFELLLPLIFETANKVHDIHPHAAQTGPAKRKDQKTMSKHLEMLTDFPEYKKLYQLLSDQILDAHS